MNDFLSLVGPVAVVLFFFLALALIIFQIVSTVRLKKQKEHFAKLHTNLRPGVEVMLASGLYGRVKRVSDEVVVVTIAQNLDIKASRFSVQEIVKE